MRKIGIVTETRAEYGILEPLIKKIEMDPELELQLYVTGMHLSKAHGYTIEEIKQSITSRIDMKIKSKNKGADMSFSVAEGISGFTLELDKNKPDLAVVLGDRIGPFSAATVAIFLRIPLAHIHGGDTSPAVFDEKIRNAITKMADIHFPVSELSKRRILNMGEEGWRVHNVGSLGLDSVLHEKTPSKKELFEKYNLNSDKKILLVIFHPVTTEWEKAGEQFDSVLKSLEKFSAQKIIIYPNSDAGSYKIIEKIKALEGKENYFIFKSIPHSDYISFMKYSDALVGNSSSGILEAPSLGLPVVNIGSRQEGRERAKNVIDVSYSPEEIGKGIEKALHDKEFLETVSRKESPYGDGHAAEKIVSVLKKIELNENLIKKKMTY